MKNQSRFGALLLAALVALSAAPALAVDGYQTPFQAVAVSSTNTAKDCGALAAQITVNNTGAKDMFVFPGSATAVATTSNGIPVRVCQGVRINFGTQGGAQGVGLITAGSDTTTADVVCTFAQTNLGRTENISYYQVPGCVTSTAITASGPITDNGGLQGNFQTFALTSGAAAATFVKISVPVLGSVSGLLHYVYEASNATDAQAFGGVIPFNAVNKAGTVTCTVGVVTTATQAALAASTGTLTNATTCVDGTGGTVALQGTDTSSITPTTNRIRYNVEILSATSPVTVTPQ